MSEDLTEWEELFERTASVEVSLEEIADALAERRSDD